MLIEEWALLPQEMLHQLDLSMRRQCEATIAVRGKYKNCNCVLGTAGLPSLLPSFRSTKLEIKKQKKFIVVNVNTKSIAAAVPTQEKFIEENVHTEVQKKYISAVPTDSSSFQQALTDSWSRTPGSRTPGSRTPGHERLSTSRREKTRKTMSGAS
ncbi:hypothetical protein TNCV_3066051 [Trichonephila clavipes]|uniref:Uncharacterized protein n=1 Tax=Trichonephila clavipes TaxID=2585209 RepID=A0A8X6RMQ1_TRICX|nr:hypothetical protein TNCV_3066051 [Trichonephila clavipes]